MSTRESPAQETGLADRVVPRGTRAALYPVPGVQSRVYRELSGQLASVVEFADFCAFLTSRVDHRAEHLVTLAEALYEQTVAEMRRDGHTTDDAVKPGLGEAGAVTREEALLGQIETLTEALRSARAIGAAVGLRMARHDLTYEAAFAHLVEESSRSNIKIRVIAESTVHPGGPS
jgi:hypothetical protein